MVKPTKSAKTAASQRQLDLASLLPGFSIDTSERGKRGITIALPEQAQTREIARNKRERSHFVQAALPLPEDNYREPAQSATQVPPAIVKQQTSPVEPSGFRIVNGLVVREARHADSEWNYTLAPPSMVTDPVAEYQRTMSKRGVIRYSRVEQGPGESLCDLEYVVVDVETTGAPAWRGHRVTEVAIVTCNANGKVIDDYTTLINPERPIPAMITAMTGIDYSLIADAPRFEQVAAEVRKRLDGKVFVAHNAGFDWRFLSMELQVATGEPLRGKLLCTVRLARKLLPQLPKRSLDMLQYYYGIENEARHRAYGDARATATIFKKLMQSLEDREVTHWNQLQRWLYARKKLKRKRTSMPRWIEGI